MTSASEGQDVIGLDFLDTATLCPVDFVTLSKKPNDMCRQIGMLKQAAGRLHSSQVCSAHHTIRITLKPIQNS